jgi:hypothetical protein
MKTLTIALVAGAALVASVGVANAQNFRDIQQDRRDSWRDEREIRQERYDVRKDWREIQQDREALRNAIRSGDRAAIANARRELYADRRDVNRDLATLHREERDLRQDRRDLWRDTHHQAPPSSFHHQGPPSWAPAYGYRARDQRELQSDVRARQQDVRDVNRDRVAMRGNGQHRGR